MKVIIAGSRRITDPHLVAWAMDRAIEHGLVVTEVVSGKEPHGVDRLGELWADAHGVPVRPFPARWEEFGPRGSPARRRAGPARNEEMACYAEALVALPDIESRGTRDMIQRARRHKLWVFQFEVEGVHIRCWWKDPVIGPGAAPYF